MNRREFTKNLALLSTAAFLPGLGCSVSEFVPRFKLGYQLFSVNDDMKKQPAKTLESLKAMGYQDFEIYGFQPDDISFYGIPAHQFKELLNELGLTTTSGHFGFSDYLYKSDAELIHFVDQVIQGSQAIGLNYITWPWLAPNYRNKEGFELMARKLNVIGQQIKDAGVGFAYHNHGFDFNDLGGITGYDIVLRETDPTLVQLQMDLYWVIHSSKKTPKEWVDEYPGRFVMWHIKDMDKLTRDYTELGNGSINYHEVLPDPSKSGLEHFYIEQGGNFTHTALQSAAASAEYFQSELQQYL